jgi:hypothetical protein
LLSAKRFKSERFKGGRFKRKPGASREHPALPEKALQDETLFVTQA